MCIECFWFGKVVPSILITRYGVGKYSHPTVRKLRHREVKWLPTHCTARSQRSQHPDPGFWLSRPSTAHSALWRQEGSTKAVLVWMDQGTDSRDRLERLAIDYWLTNSVWRWRWWKERRWLSLELGGLMAWALMPLIKIVPTARYDSRLLRYISHPISVLEPLLMRPSNNHPPLS